jgi:hypothetical protein
MHVPNGTATGSGEERVRKTKQKNTHAVRTEGGVQVVGEELVLDGLELRHFQAETEPVLAVQFKMFFALAV